MKKERGRGRKEKEGGKKGEEGRGKGKRGGKERSGSGWCDLGEGCFMALSGDGRLCALVPEMTIIVTSTDRPDSKKA